MSLIAFQSANRDDQRRRSGCRLNRGHLPAIANDRGKVGATRMRRLKKSASNSDGPDQAHRAAWPAAPARRAAASAGRCATVRKRLLPGTSAHRAAACVALRPSPMVGRRYGSPGPDGVGIAGENATVDVSCHVVVAFSRPCRHAGHMYLPHRLLRRKSAAAICGAYADTPTSSNQAAASPTDRS